MRSLTALMMITTAALASAQPSTTTLRATEKYRASNGEGDDPDRARAVADAHRKLWKAAVARLQTRADIKSLGLKPAQLGAYAAAVLQTSEEAPKTGSGAKTPQVTVVAALNGAAVAQAMAGLRRDQETTQNLVKAWNDLQQLQDGRQFAARLLTAQAAAASARTESGISGQRVVSADGHKRAMALVERALVLVPEAPHAHFARGDLLITGEQPVDAEAAFRRGLQAVPKSSDGHRRLAEALRRQKKIDEAEGELREAIRLDPFSALAHSDLAFLLDAQRTKAMDAEAEYREAVRLDPNLMDAHNGLAIALARQGKGTEAVVHFREMIRIDPDSASAYYNMASVLADLDRDEEAAAALREALRINPNHYNAHYNLGEMFRLEGKYDDSARQFREYLRLAPPDANRRNVDRAKRLVQQFEESPALTAP